MFKKFKKTLQDKQDIFENKITGKQDVLEQNIDKKQEEEIKSRKLFETKIENKQEIEFQSLNNKINVFIDNAKSHVEKILDEKIEQFKISENAFGQAIIKKLTDKAFKEKEDELKMREQVLSKQEIIIMNDGKRLITDTKSAKDITDKQQELQKELEKCRRQTKTENDVNSIRAKQIEFTLEFIKWFTKK